LPFLLLRDKANETLKADSVALGTDLIEPGFQFRDANVYHDARSLVLQVRVLLGTQETPGTAHAQPRMSFAVAARARLDSLWVLDDRRNRRGGNRVSYRLKPVQAGDSYLVKDSVLAEILDRLVAAYCPQRVYLFGSRARGDEGPDSDYDLLIIVSDDARPDRTRGRLAYEVLWGTGSAADVVVWTESQFESRRNVVASLPASVLRDGRLLYAA
jgi:predicted nucleotidyltransferase